MSEGEHVEEENRVSPDAELSRMISGFEYTALIHVAAKLGIADHLQAGPKSTSELAQLVKAEPNALYRVLRALANVGVFRESGEGTFELTPIAELLQTGRGWRSWAMMAGADWYWRPWGSLSYSVRTAAPAFEHVFGVSTFDYLVSHPGDRHIFQKVMAAITREATQAILASYDFSGLTKLVDVGGGEGILLGGILEANPELHGVLFDLPEVVNQSLEILESEDIANRCEVVGGDFFQGVPEGGDAYVLKHVIHDWSDDRALAILRNCRKAMTTQGKLLLIEYVLPPPGNEPHHAKIVDINMLLMEGGRERTADEFRRLLQGTGFELKRIVETEDLASVIEAAPI